MWKNNDCPCSKDCPDRWVSTDGTKPLTCHGTCPKYAEWSAKRSDEKKAYALLKERNALTDSKSKALMKYRRRDYSGATKKFS